MKKTFLLIRLGVLSAVFLAFVMAGQTASQGRQPAAVPSHAAQKAVLEEYCQECHNNRARIGNLSLEELDVARVKDNVKEWEKVVRKLRAGMMPPPDQERPDKATYLGLVTWLENELDRSASPYTPAPGLHRLNRTEYANAIRDLLNLDIDVAKYLPSDDSSGFDNMAGTLSVSSTLVEAYVNAGQKISRLAMGEPVTPSLYVYRAPEDSSQDYHIEGLPFGTRGGVLLDYIFPSEGEYRITITPIFGDNMSPTGFGSVDCEKLEVLLDGERVQLLDWQGGGRGGGGNCAGQGGTNRGAGATAGNAAAALSPQLLAAFQTVQRGGVAAIANLSPETIAALRAFATQRGVRVAPDAPPADLIAALQPVVAQGAANRGGAAQGGQGTQGASGNRGGGNGGMRVTIKTTAGPHKLGVTYLATNFAPLLDYNRHFMRDTVQTGPTPGYTFFPHVGTVRIEGPFNAVKASDSPSRRKIFVCRPTGAADEAKCAENIIRKLASQAYRRPATAADVNELMVFYNEGRKEGDFDHGIEVALARLLAGFKFVYRAEAEPPTAKPGVPYNISDLELASRLSFFLWSTGPDSELITLASQGRLKQPAVLTAQVRRMLKHPRSEAISLNFAGQWLNLRGLQSTSPLPLIYPDFDDPLRQAMRKEVELLFDNIVREDRSIVELLDADYTYVNERLAKHYGIKGIYGSQFRRVTLGPELDVRKGLLGKGAILSTTAKPERNSPVTRGKWVMTNILGVPPPDPPPNVPALPARVNDARGNAADPSMRQKMLEHRKAGGACINCHRLMDPIGFTLENFDAIALWRTEDAGDPIVGKETLYDGTLVEGPAGLRKWLLGYSDQFVRVSSEKLLTYALGRRLDPEDMPLVRRIAREAGRSNKRFSAIVLSIVQSDAFQKNMLPKQTSVPTSNGRKEGN
jgi:hypothetical protein